MLLAAAMCSPLALWALLVIAAAIERRLDLPDHPPTPVAPPRDNVLLRGTVTPARGPRPAGQGREAPDPRVLA